MKISRFFPIVETLRSYEKGIFQRDFFAGITVLVMLVPQAMAYAMLAGMPPIYGLYGGLIPLFLYAILGTSRQMSIGPVAISALLVLAGVSQIAEPFSEEYVGYVLLTGFLIGLLQVALGLLRLGFLVNFISHPVIIGFTSAAAIIIALSQFKDAFGFPIPRFESNLETLQYAMMNLSHIHWITVGFCFGGIILILLLKKINKKIPAALIIVILGTLITYLLGAEKLQVEIIKEVPKGLPAFKLPSLTLDKVSALLPTVFTVTLIGIVESIGIAKLLQAKHSNYNVDPDQELLALGASKIGGSFFQAIPTSGSFTRSAVNNESGAQTTVASVITAILIGMVLLFLTPLFYYLPKAILAGIILLSVKSLFEWKEAMGVYGMVTEMTSL